MDTVEVPFREVIKDLSDDYNNKISSFLEEIDEIKVSLLYDKKNIILLNDRIHSLFVKLYPKIIKLQDGSKKIKVQYKYHHLFERNKSRIWRTKKLEEGEVVDKFNKNYFKFKLFVERRELHLNNLLEEIGLTAAEKVKGRRIR